MRVRHDDSSPDLPTGGEVYDEVSRFFESFEDHFFDNPDFDIPGNLDANISGYMATISWTSKVKGEAVDFTCRRIVGRESKQWLTYQGDGVRQLEPPKPFDSLQCASVLKAALDAQKKKGRQ